MQSSSTRKQSGILSSWQARFVSMIAVQGLCVGLAAAEMHWLTEDGLPKRDPAFVPGKNQIVYSRESNDTAGMELVLLDLKTRKTTKLHSEQPAGDREISFSKDGKVYAYNIVRGLSSKIRVVDGRDGKSLTIPKVGKHSWANWPSVAPDGNKIVFVQNASKIHEFTIGRGAEGIRQLSPPGDRYSDYWPRYSPDGSKIVFASNRDDDFEIYIMNADGTNQRRVTRSPGIDMHPVFIKDGTKILFTSNRDGNHEIYYMSLNDGRQHRVTHHPERDDFVIAHPLGKSIVFVAERKGRFDICQVPLFP